METSLKPTLAGSLRCGLRSGIFTGLAVGLLEGNSVLGHVKSAWGNIAPGDIFKEVLRLYSTTVLAEALVCGLFGLVLALVLHALHAKLGGPDRTSTGRDAVVAGLTTAIVLSLYVRLSIKALYPLRRALHGETLETGLQVLFVCLLIGAAVGLLIQRFQENRPAILVGLALASPALIWVLVLPFHHYLGLKQVKQQLVSGRPELISVMILILAALGALLLFWRLAAATRQQRRVGLPARWLDLVIIVLLALCSLPGWLAGEPQWKTNQEAAADPWRHDRNAILISVDTLRGDRLEPGNEQRVATPNIDRMASDGVVFTEAEAPAPWTLPSVASMLTSLHPPAHGTFGQGSRLSPQMITLAEAISREGLTTKAVLANGWLNFPFNLHQGFDNYQFTYSKQSQPQWWPGLIFRRSAQALGFGGDPFMPKTDQSVAENLVDKSINYLEQNAKKGNFFLWIHLVDPHDPYVARGQYRRDAPAARGHGAFPRYDSGNTVELRKGRLMNQGERERMENLYDLEVRYTDDEVGRLMECLQRLGIEGKTLIILTSDHGEEFWEHGNVNHGHSLYNELLHIPLIVRPPTGYPVAERRQGDVVRLIDVAPTVLDFLEIDPPQFWEGESLLPLVSGEETGHRPSFGGNLVYYQEQKSVRLGHHKYIRTPRTGDEELYDLDADPAETVNLADQMPDLVSEMSGILEDHLAAQRSLADRFPSLVTEEDEVDDRAIEELKALGYVQ